MNPRVIFENLSIKGKLMALSLIASGTALILARAAFLGYDYFSVRAALLQNLTVQAEIVGLNSASAIMFEDSKSAAQTLSALRVKPNIMIAGIYSKNGKIFSTWRRNDSLTSSFAERCPPNQESHRFGSNSLELFHPIIFDGATIGMVYIRSDLSELSEQLHRYVGITFGVMFISFIIVIVISRKLGDRISEPILEALRRSHDELEKRVQERTAQLELANDDTSRLNKFLDSIIENMPNMVFVKDQKELRFVRFNKAGEQLLGYKRSDLIGKNDYDFFPKSEADFFTAKDREVLSKQKLLDIAEEPIQTKENGLRILHTKKIPIFDDKGDPLYLLGISEDITEQKAAEEAIKSLNKELEKKAALLEDANRELESFAYSVSHDLRAPLRAIDGFSQALLEDYSKIVDAQGQEFLNRIRASTQRMGQLIDDILNLSRISLSPMERGTVDMTALGKNIMAELEKSQPDRVVFAQIAEGMTAHGDARLIRIALENLLGNAWKYSSKRADAKIEFGVTHNDGTPTYYVRDNGAGFDMTYAKKLFGAFQRLHTEAEFSGTGVGLATVKRIISRHHGRIWAESAVEQGATFFFTL